MISAARPWMCWMCGAAWVAASHAAPPSGPVASDEIQPITRVFDRQTLFQSGTHDTHTFRIPALIAAANGDLIAACDARRRGAADLIASRDIDIVLRRSTDGGKTWLPLQVMCDFGPDKPASDPSLILDRSNGAIFCFYNFMDQIKAPKVFRLYVQRSDDHGATWGESRDITESIAPADSRREFQFITSGRGAQARDGTLLHTLVNLKRGLFVFGSDDHGKHWRAMSGPIHPANESKIIECVDGAWMINARVNRRGVRWVHRSLDQGATWQSAADQRLVDPGCNASIIRYTLRRDGYAKDRMLFCNAKSSKGREMLTLRLSDDEGKTWSHAKVIDAGAAAYSSLAICPDGSIGILYEPGYREIRFLRVTLEDLTSGEDRLIKPWKR